MRCLLISASILVSPEEVFLVLKMVVRAASISPSETNAFPGKLPSNAFERAIGLKYFNGFTKQNHFVLKLFDYT